MASSLGVASLACSAAVCTVVRRMLLAWKNAQRLEASTFLAIDSVCAPLPSVSDSARHSAITAIRSAIFLFSPDACSACSACSMLSCALMILLPRSSTATMDEQVGERKPSGAGVRALVNLKQSLAVDPGINLGRRQ